jgi:hypothetical protein
MISLAVGGKTGNILKFGLMEMRFKKIPDDFGGVKIF